MGLVEQKGDYCLLVPRPPKANLSICSRRVDFVFQSEDQLRQIWIWWNRWQRPAKTNLDLVGQKGDYCLLVPIQAKSNLGLVVQKSGYCLPVPTNVGANLRLVDEKNFYCLPVPRQAKANLGLV